MKRILIAALAALTMAGPMIGAAHAAPGDSRSYNERSDRNDHRDRGRDGWNDHQRGESNSEHAWRRGDRLSAYQRSHFRQVDYRRAHLRAPPRGYHYVRDDRGELLLVGLATGVILGIIASR